MTDAPATSPAVEHEGRVHVSVYARQPLTIVRGEGCWVWNDAGREYLNEFWGTWSFLAERLEQLRKVGN